MIILSGADLVLPDRVQTGSLIIDGGAITDIVVGSTPLSGSAVRFDLHGHYIVPGFIDVHVHGLEGIDSLDGPGAIANMAARLPRFGVTAFCPTTIACPPDALRGLLAAVREARTRPPGGGARVLPAHLESNFINPEFKGAQPARCLRLPPGPHGAIGASDAGSDAFTGADILAEIERARPDVGIVTVAPELPGGLNLVRELVAHGHHVSLGHSGASYEIANAAIAAGASQATHLFNRMPPVGHREPGLAGAVLHSEEVAAEIVCDGVHVHPAMARVAIAAKHPSRVMAITDGTAGSALPVGAHTAIGGQRITVGDAAYLDDGTLAGSVLTMDGAFARLVGMVGLTPVDAAILCATTPARELGLHGHGVIAKGAIADLAVLNRDLQVMQTYVAATLVYSAIG